MTELVKGDWLFKNDPGVSRQSADTAPGEGAFALDVPIGLQNDTFSMRVKNLSATRLFGTIEWSQRVLRGVGGVLAVGGAHAKSDLVAGVGGFGVASAIGSHIAFGGIRVAYATMPDHSLVFLIPLDGADQVWQKYRAQVEDDGSDVYFRQDTWDGAKWVFVWGGKLSDIDPALIGYPHLWAMHAFNTPATPGNVVRYDGIEQRLDSFDALPIPDAPSQYLESFEDATWRDVIQYTNYVGTVTVANDGANARPGSTGSGSLKFDFAAAGATAEEVLSIGQVTNMSREHQIYFKMDAPTISTGLIRLVTGRQNSLSPTNGISAEVEVDFATNTMNASLKKNGAVESSSTALGVLNAANWYRLRLRCEHVAADTYAVIMEVEDVTGGGGIVTVHNSNVSGMPGNPGEWWGFSTVQVSNKDGAVWIDDLTMSEV